MKSYDCIQGTPDWAYLRLGIPCSSSFDRIVTPTGKISTQAERYMWDLLAERFTGEPLVQFTSHWMDRGSELEAEAVSFFELQRDCTTEKVGFITDDEGRWGCSPDRKIDDEALLEIKVPAPGNHVGYALKRAVEQTYYPQIMGQLWITGFQRLEIMSYSPGLPFVLVQIERDEEYIRLLSNAVETFTLELDRQMAILRARGWLEPTPRRKPVSEQDELIRTLKDSLREMKVKS